MRKIRTRRGELPLTVPTMPTKEQFDESWSIRMFIYGTTKPAQTNWGWLLRDDLFKKLDEVSKSSSVTDVSHYIAWLEHIRIPPIR